MLPSFRVLQIFSTEINLDVTQEKLAKEEKVHKSNLEAALGRELQVQEMVLCARHIKYLCQGILLVVHVTLKVPKLAQSILQVDLKE